MRTELIIQPRVTAVHKVLGDILRAFDSGDMALLLISAAFNTVDHATLLRRLTI